MKLTPKRIAEIEELAKVVMDFGPHNTEKPWAKIADELLAERRGLVKENTTLRKEVEELDAECITGGQVIDSAEKDLSAALTHAETLEKENTTLKSRIEQTHACQACPERDDNTALKEKVERLEIQSEKEACQGDMFADIIERIASEGKKDRTRAEKAETRLRDYEDDFRSTLAESCGGDDDRKHCACVPYLRRGLKRAKADLADVQATLRQVSDGCRKQNWEKQKGEINMMKSKKVEVEVVDGEGLVALIGQPVLLMCMNYFYAGVLRGVNETCVLLEKARVVYETGVLTESGYKDAQELPSSEWYVAISTIESFGVAK